MNPLAVRLLHACRRWPALATLALAVATLPAAAVDLDGSLFGTVGWAQSNRDYAWQRSITRDGTVRRDTVLGGQLDLALSTEWSATVQAKVAPAEKHDGAWDVTLPWAFVAWRPDNDWLLRAGRFRVPLFLFSETQDLGQAHDMLRLPNDNYTVNPTSDFTGLYVSRNWQRGARELSVDVYAGYANTTYRRWLRDGVPPMQAPGAVYTDVRAQSSGLVLTLRDPTFTVRGGFHRVDIKPDDGVGVPVTYPRVPLGNGLGYWQVDPALPGPGVPQARRIQEDVWALGADWQPDAHWRVVAEVLRLKQRGTEMGIDMTGGYVNLSRRVGMFTPYVTASRALSTPVQRAWVERLRYGGLPAVVPGAELLNAAQRAAADTLVVADQSTWALGVAWALSPQTKLKTEWARTRIGSSSFSANPSPGMAYARQTDIDVVSVVYTFAF